jgi:hypothetical protein
MTSKDQVLSFDREAKFYAWGEKVGENQPGWIKGRGWETKIASSEELAWRAVFPQVFGDETSCNTNQVRRLFADGSRFPHTSGRVCVGHG